MLAQITQAAGIKGCTIQLRYSALGWNLAGGMLVGFVFAYATTWLLTWLKWMGAKPPEILTLTVAAAYLAFYVANGPLHVSGVIAVVVFGLYGSATAKWNMSARVSDSELRV